MTREEAKEFFEDPHVNYQTYGYYTEEEEIEANNWAISALSEKDNTMEWIEHKSKKGTTLAVTCSKCLKPTKQGIKYLFCPHCGRKAVSE